jgi:hypothetical protein
MKENTKKLIGAIAAILFMTLTVMAVSAERLHIYNESIESSTEEVFSEEVFSEECSSEVTKEEVSENVTDEDEKFYMLGDVNFDGKITAADARLALRASAQIETLTSEQFIVADVDGNGKITASDARDILRYSALLIDSFPVK